MWGKVRCSLISSVVSTREETRVPTLEHKYTHTNRLSKKVTVDIDK